MRDALNGLFKGSTHLCSITWVTCLTAEEASPIIEMMNDGLANVKLQSKPCEDGKAQYVWEVEGDATLEGTYLPLLYESDDGSSSVKPQSESSEHEIIQHIEEVEEA